MDNASFTWLHRTKHKCRRCGAHLAGGMFSHRPQFRFPGGPIIIGIADNPLAFWQLPPQDLIENLLERIQQFTAFIQEQTAVRAFDSKETTEIGF